jgi:hypothetical protein
MKRWYFAPASKVSEEETMDHRSQTEKPNPSQAGQQGNEQNKKNSGQVDQRQPGSSATKDVQGNEQQEREKTGTR